MKNYLLPLCLFFTIGASAQKLVSATYLGTTPSFQFQLLLPTQAQYGVDYYKITYQTTDVDGSQTIASGGLAVPNTSSCNDFPLAAYCHGTVSEKEAVPSRDNSEAFLTKALASTGAVSVAPDYLGLGDNPGLHPYLHAESQATATLDLIRASREYLQDSTSVTLNGEVFVTGYSQGGHAAMATVKYVQDSGLFNEFDIVAAGPASGPYNLSGSQSTVLLSGQPYSNPGYVVYLLFAMNRVYGDIYQSVDELLKSPYDTTIPPLFDGTNDMSFINSQLPNTLSGFIQDSVLANLKADSTQSNHPIWRALKKQDNFDWAPSFPLKMYYCTQDEQVSFQNALDADSAMTANGAANVAAINKGATDHAGCIFPSLTTGGALSLMMQNTTACMMIGLGENAFQNSIEIYPNPGQSYLQFSKFEGTFSLKISDVSGQEMYNGIINSSTQLNTEKWANGIYFFRFKNGGEIFTKKWVRE